MRVLDLAWKDLKQVAKDPMSAMFLLVMPLVFTGFMGMAFSSENVGANEDHRLQIGVVDQDGVVGAQLMTLLENSSVVRPAAATFADKAELEEAVVDEDYAAVVVIPAGFSQGWLAGDWEPSLELVVSSDTGAGRIAQGAVRVAAQRLRRAVQTAQATANALATAQPEATEAAISQVRNETLEAAVAAWEDAPLTVEVERGGAAEAAREPAPTGFDQSSPGMLVQFALFGLIGAASVLVLERQSRTLQRMLTTTMSRAQIIGGHVLGMFLLILAEQALCVLAGQFLFGVDYFRSPGAILLVMVGLAAFSATLGLFISAIAKNEGQVIMFSMIFMMLLAALGGAQFPLEITGAGFARIGSLMPTYWAMRGFQNVIVRGLGFASVLKPVAILFGAAIGVFGLAVWRFRFE